MAFKYLNEFDVIFLSYDEDNAEENWADLVAKVPWAKRVHGVKGSDDAHKAAARLSDTDMFVSVDADNIVDPTFFDMELDLDHPKLKGKAISWAAKNVINGLEYGNGGLKLWPTQYVLDMKTHEHAEADQNQVDFCWEDSYVQMTNQYSTTHPNGSPRQAWRAGFREGVKMSLSNGLKVDPKNFKKEIWWGNYKRLITWCSVGADVEFGEWAMWGARQGCNFTNLQNWDYVQVRDFEVLNSLYWEIAESFASPQRGPMKKCYKTGVEWDEDTLRGISGSTASDLCRHLGLEITTLTPSQSTFFKAATFNVPRMNKMFTETELNELRRLNR